MTIFCSKSLGRYKSISELLREKREKHGWDIKTTSHKTHIPPKYIEFLEKGTFYLLPKAKAHRTAYIKEYAKVLGFDQNYCLERFALEEGFSGIADSSPSRSKPFFNRSLSIIVRNFFIGTIVAGLAAFLITQVKSSLEPPHLDILNPSDGYVTTERSITLEGVSDNGATIRLNGEELPLDKRNHFSVKLDLVHGLNTLELTAIKKRGKATTKTLNIIVRSPTTVSSN